MMMTMTRMTTPCFKHQKGLHPGRVKGPDIESVGLRLFGLFLFRACVCCVVVTTGIVSYKETLREWRFRCLNWGGGGLCASDTLAYYLYDP